MPGVPGACILSMFLLGFFHIPARGFSTMKHVPDSWLEGEPRTQDPAGRRAVRKVQATAADGGVLEAELYSGPDSNGVRLPVSALVTYTAPRPDEDADDEGAGYRFPTVLELAAAGVALGGGVWGVMGLTEPVAPRRTEGIMMTRLSEAPGVDPSVRIVTA